MTQQTIQYVYKPVHTGRRVSTESCLRYWIRTKQRLRRRDTSLYGRRLDGLLDVWIKQDWEKKPLISDETMEMLAEGLWQCIGRVGGFLFILLFLLILHSF